MLQEKFSNYIETNRKDILIIIFVCVLTIGIRIPFLRWSLLTDEGGYAYTAYWWFKGIPLYSDQLWFDRPQGIFLAYKLGMVLLGEETWAIRLWGALWAAGTSIYIYLIAKRLSNINIAIFTSIIYAIFSTMPQIEGFSANAEVFALFPATASIYYLVLKKYCRSGFLASLAFLMKPSGGSIILLGMIWLLIEKEDWGNFFRNFFRYFLGIFIVLILAFLHGVITVGFSNYWFAVVGYRFYLKAVPAEKPLIKFLKTSIVWLPLLIVLIFSFGSLTKKNFIILFSWLISAFIGMTLGKNWEYHYFIQIIPPLAYGSSIGLSKIWRYKCSFSKFIIGFLLGLPIIILCFFIVIQPKLGTWIIYHRPGYQKASSITQYLKNNTNEDDTIFITFYEAEYYFLSKRRSCVPYIYRIHIVFIPGAYESAIEAVNNRIPVYVVALDPPLTSIDPANRFQDALDQNYYIETYIQDTPIYKRKAFVPSE